MKGCLKLSPTPTWHDSQGQHHNEHVEANCYHAPTATSSPTTASSSTTAPSSGNTDAANTTPSQAHTQTHRKCVAFCAEGSETVYPADEWDRTPAEPARKLSYQDLLELKEIQRSLPHANQPPDTITGRPGKQFLLGVPIVLLPLLGSSPDDSAEHGAQESVTKKPFCSSGCAPGRTNASGTGWGPPSLKRQAQTTPPRPFVPFPPRPPPLPMPSSGPASKSTYTSALTSPSSISYPLRMNSQTPNKTGSTSPPPSSPTSPYPVSYSNRPSTTTSATYPYSSFHQQTQVQPQSRALWTPPSSLSHLMPSLPIKPREKPKFEFITMLDSGGNGSPGPSPAVSSDGPNSVDVTTTKVPLDSTSTLAEETIKKKPELKKEKERKFILVNDMEIELDESEEEEESTPLSGSITSTRTTSTTREVTTTTTSMTTTTEKTTTTITTTASSERPSSPLSIMAPVPVKSRLLDSQSPLPSSPSLPLTPPTTPPRSNKSLRSPSSSPSTASRGKMKQTGLMGSPTSRERSGSTGSDTSGTTSPSRNTMTGMCSPVKFKSNMLSQEAAGLRV